MISFFRHSQENLFAKGILEEGTELVTVYGSYAKVLNLLQECRSSIILCSARLNFQARANVTSVETFYRQRNPPVPY